MHIMKQSSARRTFKRNFGQANHFLVTCLVGLHTLEHSDISNAPIELHAAWSPKDKASSIYRSKHFVLQSFLGWAVDSLDTYLGLLNRRPSYLQDCVFKARIDGLGRSVSKRMQAYADHFSISNETTALMDVLITWRNNVFHELSDNQLKPETLQALKKNASSISTKYRGLNVASLPQKAQAGESLTFKEGASLINAVHEFARETDEAILERLDASTFLTEAVQDAIDDKAKGIAFYAKYKSLGVEQRRRFIENWLVNTQGFSDVSIETSAPCLQLQRTNEMHG
jgi:hypothetical protein